MPGYPDYTKVLLIIPYFGRVGPWFPLYLRSLAKQNTLDLLFVSDLELTDLPANVRLFKTSASEFRGFVESRLDQQVQLPTPRHLCDLRPSYGFLFADQLRDYRYWAYGDEDVLYGDVDSILQPILDDGYDVITGGRNMTTGHLTIVKNDDRLNRLALDDPAYRELLQSDEVWCYDENSWGSGRPSPGSFTQHVQRLEASGKIRVKWGLPIRGDFQWPGKVMRYDGSALTTENGTSLLYFHWGRAKRSFAKAPFLFSFNLVSSSGEVFSYDRFGFYRPGLYPGREALRHSLRSLHGTRIGNLTDRKVLAATTAIVAIAKTLMRWRSNRKALRVAPPVADP